MLTNTDITNLHGWCATQPFQLGVLFGSQATGRARPNSDVDIAVWPREPFDPWQKLVWIGQLETLLQREVSLVFVTRKIDPLLGYEITKHGRLLYEATPDRWAKERLYWWHQYNDTAPLRRAAEQVLRDFAAEVSPKQG